MSSNLKCKSCGSTDIDYDPSRADAVCTNCGIVLESSIIVSDIQFEENAHGGSSAIGTFVSSESKGIYHREIFISHYVYQFFLTI